MFLLCLLCQKVFPEEVSGLPYWNPKISSTEFIYETKGDEYETTRMRVSCIAESKIWDPYLPNVFGGKRIKLRDKEADVIAKLDSNPTLLRAADPVCWSLDFVTPDEAKIKYRHYSLHSYILKNNPKNCFFLYFSNDEYGLERFCLVSREIPFTAGEEFFLYPNVYPGDMGFDHHWYVNDWKKEIAAWNSLSEYEQYFCMFSLPLISGNSLEVFSVNPEPDQNPFDDTCESRDRLESGWGCHSKKDFIELIGKFHEQGGWHGPWYKRLCQYVDKYPGKSPEEISALECLGMGNTTSLFFVMQMKEKLGEHGMLAWDYGRFLTVLRWGIAAGWISEQAAMQEARPIIDELLACYDSWEDYLAHYAIGRGLFALDNNYSVLDYEYDALLDSIKYTRNYENVDKAHQLTFHGFKFPAQKQGGNAVLSNNDVWYSRTGNASQWETAYAIYDMDYNDLEKEHIKFVESFCAKNGKVPCLAIMLADSYAQKGYPPKKIMAAYENAAKSFKNALPEKKGINSDSELYRNFYGRYITAAIGAKDYERMYSALSDLDDEHTTRNQMMQFLYSLYYHGKMEGEKKQKKIDQYKQRIIDFYNLQRDKPLNIEDEESLQIFDRLGKLLQENIVVRLEP